MTGKAVFVYPCCADILLSTDEASYALRWVARSHCETG